MTTLATTLDILSFMIYQILASTLVVLAYTPPGNLLLLALTVGPLGCLWSLYHGYPPKAVGLRAAQWVAMFTILGTTLVATGTQMTPWPGLENLTNGVIRGACFGIAMAGCRLFLWEP
jgi:hypothetical protein